MMSMKEKVRILTAQNQALGRVNNNTTSTGLTTKDQVCGQVEHHINKQPTTTKGGPETLAVPENKDLERQSQELWDMQLKLTEMSKAKQKVESFLKQAIKLQQTNMDRTSDLVTSLPDSQALMKHHRLFELKHLIEATVSDEAKWIYTEELSEWPRLLATEEGKPWSSKDPIHPTIKILLQSSTIALWAADKEASEKLGKAMTAFQTLELAENDIKRFINSSPQQEDDIKQFMKMESPKLI